MRPFNDAQNRYSAKLTRGNVVFQFETAVRLVSPAALLMILMLLSAALPAGLVLYKRETEAKIAPYLEIDVSSAPGPAYAKGSDLHRPG